MNGLDEVRSMVRPVWRATALLRPAERYGEDDDESFAIAALHELDSSTLARALGVDRVVAEAAIQAAQQASFTEIIRLLREQPRLRPQLQRINMRTYYKGESPVRIVDVRPAEPIHDSTPFTLLVQYQNAADAPIVLVSVRVEWLGRPFVVERAVDAAAVVGVIEVTFDEQRTLPIGPAEFTVSLFRGDGAQAMFRRTAYVLPAVLSLVVGLYRSAVTRSVYRPDEDDFLVDCDLTVANGTDGPLQLDKGIRWHLMTGGDGSAEQPIDAGTCVWPMPISIPAASVWIGSIRIRSPRGGPAFDAFDRRQDVAIVISVLEVDGTLLTAATVARTMPTVGINILEVGTFAITEEADLVTALDRLRDHLALNSFALKPVDYRRISAADAGGLTVIENEVEFGDLLEGWSCSNDFVDVFTVQAFDWDERGGRAGAIPGPVVKGGRTDGVAVNKIGYDDTHGIAHLIYRRLALLIGHEFGHYLGLCHLEEEDNLMYPYTTGRGPGLHPGQCATMVTHGYVH